MATEGAARCCNKRRNNSDAIFAVVCFLVVIGNRVETRSVSELLSDLEISDLDLLPGNRHQGEADLIDDVIDDDPVAKRSPYVSHEVSLGNLKKNLNRAKLYSSREKHSSPLDFHGSRPTLPVVGAALEGSRISKLSPLDAFLEGFKAGWSKARSRFQDPVSAGSSDSFNGNDNNYPWLHLGKRGDFTGEGDRSNEVRSSSNIHPVYLGMGQDTANAALSAFADILAEEEKRKNSEHPVRFIGKRYLTDE